MPLGSDFQVRHALARVESAACVERLRGGSAQVGSIPAVLGCQDASHGKVREGRTNCRPHLFLLSILMPSLGGCPLVPWQDRGPAGRWRLPLFSRRRQLQAAALQALPQGYQACCWPCCPWTPKLPLRQVHQQHRRCTHMNCLAQQGAHAKHRAAGRRTMRAASQDTSDCCRSCHKVQEFPGQDTPGQCNRITTPQAIPRSPADIAEEQKVRARATCPIPRVQGRHNYDK